MRIKKYYRLIISYLKNQSIDIRIRMMFFLEYAILLACSIGTVCMILLKQPVSSMFPNIVLFVMSFAGLYLSHARKMYDMSIFLLVIGCANFAVPWMFFSAGGNDSGMPIWFVFSVVVTCMLSSGKTRILLSGVTIIEDIICIFIGQFYPNTVTRLIGENAEFYDEVQSYGVVCIFLAMILSIYIATYDSQRRKLEEQGKELLRLMQTDALTGMYNRRAYYDEVLSYKNSGMPEDLVLVAMDVNGLKRVNDTLGHAAGDDYICAAAKAMTSAMGEYGRIFRIGGDEFTAILHCSKEEAVGLDERLKECIANSDSSWSDKMTIATGIVYCSDESDADFVSVEKLADKKMYDNKSAFYRENGIERRRNRD